MMMAEKRDELTIRLTKSTYDDMMAYAAKDKVLVKYMSDPSLLANVLIELLIECRKPVPNQKLLSVRYWVANEEFGHVLKEIRIPDLGEGYSVMECIADYDCDLFLTLEKDDIHSVEEVTE